jgi:hypothetical protein
VDPEATRIATRIAETAERCVTFCRAGLAFLEQVIGISGDELVTAGGEDFRQKAPDAEVLHCGIVEKNEAATFQKLVAILEVGFYAFVAVVPIYIAEAELAAELYMAAEDIAGGNVAAPKVEKLVG